MNAQSPIKAAGSTKDEIRSLMDHCRDKHWRLLQSFALAEIELAQYLGEESAQTFGAKVNKFKNVDKALRTSLIESRNLVAHGFLSVVDVDGKLKVACIVADFTLGRNAIVRSRKEVDDWAKAVERHLARFLQKAAQAKVA